MLFERKKYILKFQNKNLDSISRFSTQIYHNPLIRQNNEISTIKRCIFKLNIYFSNTQFEIFKAKQPF